MSSSIRNSSYILHKICVKIMDWGGLFGDIVPTWWRDSYVTHTEKSFWYLFKLNQIWIVITLFRFIWHQTKIRLVQNQSKKCNYNPNYVKFNEISKRFLCVHIHIFILDVIHISIIYFFHNFNMENAYFW